MLRNDDTMLSRYVIVLEGGAIGNEGDLDGDGAQQQIRRVST